MEKEKLDHLRDVSMKNLEMHNEVMSNAYKTMNNIIFVVSTGSFVLTISFIGSLKTHIYYSFLLLISWIFLFFTITLNFVAHWITAQSSLRSNELTNEARTTGFPDGGNFNKKSKVDSKIIKYKIWAKIVNTCVLVFLPLGIISLICFSWMNLISQNKTNVIQNQVNLN